ncbi:hypothetical protein Lal_00036541 [Lupinus albus]|nr:hypothetical protein Lal_00036541 [Lupinus albus]
MAIRDMAIVGRLWDEDGEVEVEEEPFTVVLSKSQKKKMQKVLYWNCRGFGNSKTRLVFKNYCLANKPDLVFIAEPMIDFVEVNNTFWSYLSLKSFGFNNRGSLKPNLWGLCNMWLNPNVLVTSNQHLTCILEVENKKVYINDVGSNLPHRFPSDEFKLFIDAGSLVHLVTRGADFTWTNRRVGVGKTEKRLDS